MRVPQCSIHRIAWSVVLGIDRTERTDDRAEGEVAVDGVGIVEPRGERDDSGATPGGGGSWVLARERSAHLLESGPLEVSSSASMLGTE